jgi:hypothetical protein
MAMSRSGPAYGGHGGAATRPAKALRDQGSTAKLRRWCQTTPFASKEHMEYNPAVEDELLVEVQRAEVAFVGASHRCKELGTDRVTECMEPASRN